MRWECRERFPRHWLQRKPLVSDSGMHHGTCVMHVSWCMSGSLTRGGGEKVPGIPGACATRNFTYLVRGPCFTGSLNSEISYNIVTSRHGDTVSLARCERNQPMNQWIPLTKGQWVRALVFEISILNMREYMPLLQRSPFLKIKKKECIHINRNLDQI